MSADEDLPRYKLFRTGKKFWGWYIILVHRDKRKNEQSYHGTTIQLQRTGWNIQEAIFYKRFIVILLSNLAVHAVMLYIIEKSKV